MIKATHLMINDWAIMNNEPRMVDVIYSHTSVDIYGNEYGEEDLDPIPLTEELLSLNGFEWTATWGSWCYFGKDRKFIMVTKGDDGFGIHGTKIRFNYVHELQNMLRMSGLDYMADNFRLE